MAGLKDGLREGAPLGLFDRGRAELQIHGDHSENDGGDRHRIPQRRFGGLSESHACHRRKDQPADDL